MSSSRRLRSTAALEKMCEAEMPRTPAMLTLRLIRESHRQWWSLPKTMPDKVPDKVPAIRHALPLVPDLQGASTAAGNTPWISLCRPDVVPIVAAIVAPSLSSASEGDCDDGCDGDGDAVADHSSHDAGAEFGAKKAVPNSTHCPRRRGEKKVRRPKKGVVASLTEKVSNSQRGIDRSKRPVDSEATPDSAVSSDTSSDEESSSDDEWLLNQEVDVAARRVRTLLSSAYEKPVFAALQGAKLQQRVRLSNIAVEAERRGAGLKPSQKRRRIVTDSSSDGGDNRVKELEVSDEMRGASTVDRSCQRDDVIVVTAASEAARSAADDLVVLDGGGKAGRIARHISLNDLSSDSSDASSSRAELTGNWQVRLRNDDLTSYKNDRVAASEARLRVKGQLSYVPRQSTQPPLAPLAPRAEASRAAWQMPAANPANNRGSHLSSSAHPASSKRPMRLESDSEDSGTEGNTEKPSQHSKRQPPSIDNRNTASLDPPPAVAVPAAPPHRRRRVIVESLESDEGFIVSDNDGDSDVSADDDMPAPSHPVVPLVSNPAAAPSLAPTSTPITIAKRLRIKLHDIPLPSDPQASCGMMVEYDSILATMQPDSWEEDAVKIFSFTIPILTNHYGCIFTFLRSLHAREGNGGMTNGVRWHAPLAWITAILSHSSKHGNSTTNFAPYLISSAECRDLVEATLTVVAAALLHTLATSRQSEYSSLEIASNIPPFPLQRACLVLSCVCEWISLTWSSRTPSFNTHAIARCRDAMDLLIILCRLPKIPTFDGLAPRLAAAIVKALAVCNLSDKDSERSHSGDSLSLFWRVFNSVVFDTISNRLEKRLFMLIIPSSAAEDVWCEMAWDTLIRITRVIGSSQGSNWPAVTALICTKGSALSPSSTPCSATLRDTFQRCAWLSAVWPCDDNGRFIATLATRVFRSIGCLPRSAAIERLSDVMTFQKIFFARLDNTVAHLSSSLILDVFLAGIVSKHLMCSSVNRVVANLNTAMQSSQITSASSNSNASLYPLTLRLGILLTVAYMVPTQRSAIVRRLVGNLPTEPSTLTSVGLVTQSLIWLSRIHRLCRSRDLELAKCIVPINEQLKTLMAQRMKGIDKAGLAASVCFSEMSLVFSSLLPSDTLRGEEQLVCSAIMNQALVVSGVRLDALKFLSSVLSSLLPNLESCANTSADMSESLNLSQSSDDILLSLNVSNLQEHTSYTNLLVSISQLSNTVLKLIHDRFMLKEPTPEDCCDLAINISAVLVPVLIQHRHYSTSSFFQAFGPQSFYFTREKQVLSHVAQEQRLTAVKVVVGVLNTLTSNSVLLWFAREELVYKSEIEIMQLWISAILDYADVGVVAFTQAMINVIKTMNTSTLVTWQCLAIAFDKYRLQSSLELCNWRCRSELFTDFVRLVSSKYPISNVAPVENRVKQSVAAVFRFVCFSIHHFMDRHAAIPVSDSPAYVDFAYRCLGSIVKYLPYLIYNRSSVDEHAATFPEIVTTFWCGSISPVAQRCSLKHLHALAEGIMMAATVDRSVLYLWFKVVKTVVGNVNTGGKLGDEALEHLAFVFAQPSCESLTRLFLDYMIPAWRSTVLFSSALHVVITLFIKYLDYGAHVIHRSVAFLTTCVESLVLDRNPLACRCLALLARWGSVRYNHRREWCVLRDIIIKWYSTKSIDRDIVKHALDRIHDSSRKNDVTFSEVDMKFGISLSVGKSHWASQIEPLSSIKSNVWAYTISPSVTHLIYVNSIRDVIGDGVGINEAMVWDALTAMETVAYEEIETLETYARTSVDFDTRKSTTLGIAMTTVLFLSSTCAFLGAEVQLKASRLMAKVKSFQAFGDPNTSNSNAIPDTVTTEANVLMRSRFHLL